MTRRVWRIAVDTPDYTADDLNGEGAKRTGGRWNRQGVPVVYTAASPAVACLETLVHLKAGGLPLNRYLVRIDVPEPIWTTAKQLTVSELPVGWDARPHGKISLEIGAEWVRRRESCLLIVPSVIIPEEQNVLINPNHPDAKTLVAVKERLWLYDPRLGS